MEVDIGRKIGGKGRNKRYKTITAKNEDEAKAKLAVFVDETRKSGYFEPEKISLVDFINEHWVTKCGMRRLSHTTFSNYVHRLETRILPAFQHFQLDEIQPIHIIEFLEELEKDGARSDGKKGKLASSTIFYYYRILNHIFNFAVEIKFLKESPLKGVEKPKVTYKKSDVYDVDEAVELLECLDTETDYPHWVLAIKLAITTGMRRSEIFGLEFKHINLDGEEPILTVKQALTHSKQFGYRIDRIKKANDEYDEREIVLSEELVKPIKDMKLVRREEQLAMKKKDRWMEGKYDLVFCHEDGHPYFPNSLRTWWVKFIERHNLKYINIHALRHTSAALLINEDVHPKVISERLGHSDIKTTMNIYGHVFRKADKAATQKMDDILFKSQKNR